MTVRIGICVLTIVAMVGVARGVAPEKGASNAKATSPNGKVTAGSVGTQKAAASGVARPTSGAGMQSQKLQAKKNLGAAKAKRPTTKKETPNADVSEPASTGESATAKSNSVRRIRGQRDPFETVIRSQPEGPGCAIGKKCLVVGKMDLKGVVRSQNGMIAIVSTEQRKTYFLHENDPVYNGHVVKINPDSIVFRETVTDRVGRQSTRDVVKRITRPAA